MTKKEIDAIEKDYLHYSWTESAKRILRLVAYVRELESTLAGFRSVMPLKNRTAKCPLRKEGK